MPWRSESSLARRGAPVGIRLAMAIACALVVLGASGPASAIPRFALRVGVTCSACHVNPSGGGMRNRFGRNVFVPTRLAARPWSGAAAAPLVDVDLGPNVAVGTDTRAALFMTRPRAPQVTTFSFFLMQADLYVSADVRDSLTLYLDIGFYGSGEAMVLIRPGGGLFVKAGRFMPAYGLRLENHNVFTRQDIGFGPRQKDIGVEVGLERGPLLLQLAAVNGNPRPDSQLDDNWQKVLVGRVQLLRPGKLVNLMAGASGWYNIVGLPGPPTDTRAGDLRWGGFAGASLGRLAYLAEAHVVQTRRFDEYKWTRTYVSYQELDLLLARGLELNLNYEYQDPDLRYADNALHRGLIGFELFPVPNLEVKVFYRYLFGPSSNPLSGLHEAFASLHLYL